MLTAILVLASRPPHLGASIRHDLAFQLQGVPLHGHSLRAKVVEVLDHYSGPAGKMEATFVHPSGWVNGTIVSVQACDSQFLVWKNQGATKVTLLSNPQGDFPSLYVQEAFRFGKSLVEVNLMAGADYDKPEARVFRLSKGDWRPVQVIEAVYENADHPFPVKVRGQRLSMTIDERAAPHNFETCRVCPWLRYRERWVYREGRFHQVSLKRLSTPLAKLDDLIGLAHRRQRADFAKSVVKPIRTAAWRILSGLYHDDNGFEIVDRTHEADEATKLKSNGYAFVLKRHSGNWVLSDIVPVAKAK